MTPSYVLGVFVLVLLLVWTLLVFLHGFIVGTVQLVCVPGGVRAHVLCPE